MLTTIIELRSLDLYLPPGSTSPRLGNEPGLKNRGMTRIWNKFTSSESVWADRKLAFCRNNWFGTVTVSGSLS